MAPLAHPNPEDVVIHRRSSSAFTVGLSSGSPQILCETFEEALRRGGGFASDRHASLWFTEDNQEFVLLADEQLLRRVWAEYVYLPGLRLTRDQARRLWAVDDQTCTRLFDSLVRAHLLVRTSDGQFARMAKADVASAPPTMRHAS